MEIGTALLIKNLDTDKSSRGKFGRDIHKDILYGAGYLMEGQGQ